MHQPDDRNHHAALETWRGSWKFLAFGLVVLAYLVAIERPQWFVLRPATGTAIALASSAEAGAAKKGDADPAKP
ncbi:hypothetical protein AWL63_13700 [Sphingomonas panacis]|uniref:Uncharacterized protein n=1 Tax=Sphingomonas panacis TaxID=1560345 RepID=A0A1B3ZBR5_9SPHN|nr:hypothetical protein [Sphingomonas panacis]AOH84861.1 hypothetical protein AWL63_13700 [Sphingomonas panacis]